MTCPGYSPTAGTKASLSSTASPSTSVRRCSAEACAPGNLALISCTKYCRNLDHDVQRTVAGHATWNRRAAGAGKNKSRERAGGGEGGRGGAELRSGGAERVRGEGTGGEPGEDGR